MMPATIMMKTMSFFPPAAASVALAAIANLEDSGFFKEEINTVLETGEDVHVLLNGVSHVVDEDDDHVKALRKTLMNRVSSLDEDLRLYQEALLDETDWNGRQAINDEADHVFAKIQFLSEIAFSLNPEFELRAAFERGEVNSSEFEEIEKESEELLPLKKVFSQPVVVQTVEKETEPFVIELPQREEGESPVISDGMADVFLGREAFLERRRAFRNKIFTAVKHRRSKKRSEEDATLASFLRQNLRFYEAEKERLPRYVTEVLAEVLGEEEMAAPIVVAITRANQLWSRIQTSLAQAADTVDPTVAVAAQKPRMARLRNELAEIRRLREELRKPPVAKAGEEILKEKEKNPSTWSLGEAFKKAGITSKSNN